MSFQQMSGGGQGAPKPHNSYKTGLGFFPTTMGQFPQDPIFELLRKAPKIARGICATSSVTAESLKSGANIPLINLQDMTRAGEAEKKRLIQALGIGMTQAGFVGIYAENISHLIDRIYSEMRSYFIQPFENKIYDWTPYTPLEGYAFRGSERPQRNYGPDLRESLIVSPSYSAWPRKCPQLSRLALEYQTIMNQYSMILMDFLTSYLHEELPSLDQNSQQLKLIHYPPMKPNDDPTALWSAPHIDNNALTLLTPGTIPGLQVQSKANHWHPIIVPKGYIIACVGKQLEHKTAGVLKARKHRVANPGGSFTRMGRLSLAFYASWGQGASLRPFENCVNLVTQGMSDKKARSYLKRYPDVTVGENIKV